MPTCIRICRDQTKFANLAMVFIVAISMSQRKPIISFEVNIQCVYSLRIIGYIKDKCVHFNRANFRSGYLFIESLVRPIFILHMILDL